MPTKSIDSTNEKSFNNPLKVEKENITCKDGFCSLPNQHENQSINKSNINLFDPI